jgi:hypothetical protein
MHAYGMLGAEVSAVPEISFCDVWRRSHPGQPMHEEIERLDHCCIDLAVLASGSLDVPVTGLIEFKKWTPSVDDQIPIETLMLHVPTCKLGLRATLVDVPPSDPWINEMRSKWEVDPAHHFFLVTRIEFGRSKRQHECSVVGHAFVR